MNRGSLNTARYVDLFLSESREHVQLMEDILIRLPQEDEPTPSLHELFRHAHSLKGMSAAMGYGAITYLTHAMEEIFGALKNKEITLTDDISHELMASIEKIYEMLTFIEKNRKAPEPETSQVETLKKLLNGKTIEKRVEKEFPSIKKVPAEHDEETYHISIHFDQDSPFLQARAILALKRCAQVGKVLESNPSLGEIRHGKFEKQLFMKFQSRVPEKDLKRILSSLVDVEQFSLSPLPKKVSKKQEREGPLALPSIRIKTELLDHFLDGVVDIMIQQEKLAKIIEASQDPGAKYELEKMEGAIKKLYSDVMKVRMLPFSYISRRFEKSVRDLAGRLNKKVSLKISGSDTELDRSILEEISDPINHIIRNSIDHGIEDPSMRKRLKKPETGQIIISLVRKSDFIDMTIEDDGSGIDIEKVKRLAYQEGYITREKYETISDQEAFMLVTIPGFSTVKKLTTLSGRGIGLDAVRTKIENFGGKMKIKARLGGGTSILFKLPLSVAMINAFIIKSEGYLFAIPVSSIEKTISVSPSEIDYDESKRAFITVDGKVIRIFDLSSILSLVEREHPFDQSKPIFLFQLGKAKAGLSVDEIVSRKSIIVKSLGHPLDQMREYSGVSILEGGRLALILDISNMLSI